MSHFCIVSRRFLSRAGHVLVGGTFVSAGANNLKLEECTTCLCLDGLQVVAVERRGQGCDGRDDY